MFVLCLDKLSEIVENEVASKRWKPFRITRKGPSLSHIFFADDLIFFGLTDATYKKNILDVIDRFCGISGQKVSPLKSKILFSSNTPGEMVEKLFHMSGMAATEDIGKYLGVPLHTRRVNKAMFHELLTRVQGKLTKWKADQLSIARRRVVIQSVSSTIASHTMKSVMLPKSVSDAIDQANRDFLWGGSPEKRKIPLVK